MLQKLKVQIICYLGREAGGGSSYKAYLFSSVSMMWHKDVIAAVTGDICFNDIHKYTLLGCYVEFTCSLFPLWKQATSQLFDFSVCNRTVLTGNLELRHESWDAKSTCRICVERKKKDVREGETWVCWGGSSSIRQCLHWGALSWLRWRTESSSEELVTEGLVSLLSFWNGILCFALVELVDLFVLGLMKSSGEEGAQWARCSWLCD
jgi:hypothetical protein